MKNLSFLLLFISTLFFAQRGFRNDTIDRRERYEPSRRELQKCERQKKVNKKIFDRLQIESKNINFNTLAAKIIEDLDPSDFQGEIILFYFRYSNTICGNLDDEGFVCDDEHTRLDPFYGTRSWTVQDIERISKVLKQKAVVPSNKNFGFSISNNLFEDVNRLNVAQNYKLGEVYDDEVKKTRAFYYWTENSSLDNLTLKTNYIYNEVTNYKFDTLFFKFENLLGYKVKVTQMVNNKPLEKIYQYYNGEWSFVE